MIVDLLSITLLILFFVKGFRSGFIPSLLGLAGYLLGGFLGLLSAREVTGEWQGFWSVIGAYLVLILVGANIGQVIMRSLGRGMRGLVGPLKLLDSLLGALLGAGKGLILIFLLLRLLGVFPSESVESAIDASEIATYLEAHTPRLIEEGFTKLKELPR